MQPSSFTKALHITQNFENVRVSLVNGDPGVRRARQILLRSERYDVRSYSTCAALLADPLSRDYPCIVLDVGLHDIDGPDLIRRMRATGWHGRAIFLDGSQQCRALLQNANEHGDMVFDRTIGDRSLIAAVAAAVDHGKRHA